MTDPIIAAAEFIGRHLEWLRHHPACDEQLTTIEACARVVRGLVSGKAGQKYLGPCGAPTREDTSVWDGERYWEMSEEGPPCEGDVYGRAGGDKGTCRTCGAEYDQAERRAWLDDEVRSRAFRAAHIADAYQINVKTIRSWADRGHLIQHGTDRDGKPLYNVGDVLDLAVGDAARRAEREAKRAASRAAPPERMSA